MTDPWYKDGLRFRCTQCGKCCTGEPGYVWVTDEQIRQIAEFRGESVEQFRQLYIKQVGQRLSLREKPNGDCVMYDRARGCTVYPVRPPQCRSWPFWDSNLATPADWERTCDFCPGSGRGDLIPVEEIVRNMKLIRI